MFPTVCVFPAESVCNCRGAVSAMDVDGTDMDFGVEGSEEEGDAEDDSGSEPALAPRAQVRPAAAWGRVHCHRTRCRLAAHVVSSEAAGVPLNSLPVMTKFLVVFTHTGLSAPGLLCTPVEH